MKQHKNIFFTLTLCGVVLFFLFGLQDNFKGFFSEKLLSSSAINTQITPPISGLTCQKISWYEDEQEIIDFVLTSESKSNHTIQFLSKVLYSYDSSINTALHLIEKGGDITLGQNDLQKRKFYISYSENSLVYTQSLFFQGAEYRCPSVEIHGIDDIESDTCQDMYNELELSERMGVTCTGDRSFVIERNIGQNISSDNSIVNAISSGAMNALFGAIFASPPPITTPPPTSQPQKKNILKKIAGGTCRFVGNTAKTAVVVGMCPFKICDASINGLGKQLSKLDPKVGNLFKNGTSLAISKSPAGAYVIVGSVGGILERIVVDKQSPANATLNQIFQDKPDNALLVVKGTGQKICDIWSKK